MKKIMTIGGSSSRNSINKQLAEYAGSLVGDSELIQIDLNEFQMPLFSIDLENESGFPEAVLELDKLVTESDGFIISLAEHNGAYAAAFKNAFDWLSRINGKVWRNKPVLLLSTSPGARGGATVLEIANNRFPYNGGQIVGSMALPSFFENFKDGRIIDDRLQSDLLNHIDQFKKAI